MLCRRVIFSWSGLDRPSGRLPGGGKGVFTVEVVLVERVWGQSEGAQRLPGLGRFLGQAGVALAMASSIASHLACSDIPPKVMRKEFLN